MIFNIVHNTNQKIESIIAEISQRPSHIRTTDYIKMRRFLGSLLYARGLLGQNKCTYKRLFMEEFGHPVFGAVMSEYRFGFLHANLTFDNVDTRHQRWLHDQFAAVRDLFEKDLKALVSQIQEFVDLSGRVISLDRLYTSLELFDWLQTQGISTIGDIDCMRKGIPSEIKTVTGREMRSYQVYWNNDNEEMNLNSYVGSIKSKGKKNVLLLSTVSLIIFRVTKNDGVRNPAIYKLYDFTKGGTEIIDHRINFYAVHTKSRRWTMAYILDTARVNSQTIHAIKTNVDPRKCTSLTYGWNFVKAICKPRIERRKSKACTFARNTMAKMDLMLGHSRRQVEEAASEVTHENKKRNRCHTCLDLAYGPDFRKNLLKVKKTINQCQVCHKHSCDQHKKKKKCVKCHDNRPNQ
ncbi:uncharacterized protein LOC135094308 [Scylla paramamosain]|uniref:uncharacterized protein LOC135094308 n=1 Tax=Scylla paramamosain TaxID=85552 RepID=UPI003082AF2A